MIDVEGTIQRFRELSETLIVTASGQTDWRPQFLLGLQTAIVLGFVIGAVVLVRRVR